MNKNRYFQMCKEYLRYYSHPELFVKEKGTKLNPNVRDRIELLIKTFGKSNVSSFRMRLLLDFNEWLFKYLCMEKGVELK